ncbi:hypothetical protein AB3N59_20325 (plasmid) [Leptospira sp. WS92.C1]
MKLIRSGVPEDTVKRLNYHGLNSRLLALNYLELEEHRKRLIVAMHINPGLAELISDRIKDIDRDMNSLKITRSSRKMTEEELEEAFWKAKAESADFWKKLKEEHMERKNGIVIREE